MNGILFDMGDVLYDATHWRRWIWRALCRCGHKFAYHEFWQAWDDNYLVDVHRGRREYSEAFQRFLLSRGLTRAAIDELEAASWTQKRQIERQTRPLLGVTATLKRLRERGLTLGILSDTESPATAIHERLEQLGLDGLFDVVVTSLDLEETKPHPIGYRRALDLMGVLPQNAAFVGHDREELAGAARIGMRTVAFNYDSDAVADIYLRRFEDLLSVAVPTRALAA